MMIYLDHAAATPVRKEVLATMLPYFSTLYANPAATHEFGQRVHADVEAARDRVQKLLKMRGKIIFTGSGTESANLALLGVMRASGKKHLITSTIEHPAVLKACAYLEKYDDCRVTYLPVDDNGRVDVKVLERAITKDTALISIMYANNEVGTIQPYQKISRIAQKHHVLFHSDACQAQEILPSHYFDLLTLNASKIYGPKGVGLLYVGEGVHLDPIIHSVGHEYGLRGGTENVPGIMGFVKALELLSVRESSSLRGQRDFLIQKLLKIPGVHLNGHRQQRLANNVNITIDGCDVLTLIHYLSQEGIYVAAGAACYAQEMEPSHVLRAMGRSKKEALSTLRLTLGRDTTRKDLVRVVKVLERIVKSLRLV